METLLIFLAIIAIQMIAAYSAKQKKEAPAKTIQKPTLPRQTTEHIQNPFKEEPKLDEARVEIKRQKPIIKEEENNSQFSILNSQLNLKNPAQGILWTAILHEPRYRVKWKRK
jgi:hypothetical protein